MNKLITAASLGILLSASGINALATAPKSVTINILNNSQYNFYLAGNEIPAGETFTMVFYNHDTRKLTFDSAIHPSPWKTSGYGNGGIAYSVDAVSGQSNFALTMGPAAATTSGDLPPTFTISGQVVGQQTRITDDFTSGMMFTSHSTSSDPTVTIGISGGI